MTEILQFLKDLNQILAELVLPIAFIVGSVALYKISKK